MIYTWLIIGGGIHGTAHALQFIRKHRIPQAQIAILDPHPHLLGRWKHITANVGMSHLRSPGAHHLHDDPFHLRTFLNVAETDYPPSLPLYERPSLAVFNAHSDSLIARFGVDKCHIQASAIGMEKIADGWRILTDYTPIEAKNVLLAMGASEYPHIPAWAKSDMPIHHILDDQFSRSDIQQGHWLVVGGGISAIQTALSLMENGMDVTLISQRDIPIRDFDSDPCWVTRLCLDDFYATNDPVLRREMIKKARYKGSMPYDVADELRLAIEKGVIQHVIAEITHADTHPFRVICADGREFYPDGAILATGYQTTAPIPVWLADAVRRYDLPLAPCGYPMVDTSLCWGEGLYVTGALAELEIGATARNIIGARLATERLRRI
ncbi:MAG: FAD/NAD(P)-binding protein [Anaerolineae bacterium]|nr:FAD/NAD(P)-binding protein [Anaerolineae bacterium]